MRNPFQFMPGEPFDRDSDEFQRSMEEFIRRGGAEGSSYDLDRDEVAAVKKALDFVNRRRFGNRDEPDIKTMMFPKLCHDLANNWRGVHVAPMDPVVLDDRSKMAEDCFTVIVDDSAVDPETVSFSFIFRMSDEFFSFANFKHFTSS